MKVELVTNEENSQLDTEVLEIPLISLDNSFKAKCKRAWEYTIGFAKKLLLIIVISSALGALIYGFIPEEFILKFAGGTNWFVVPVAALIGVPLYVNVAAIIPIIYSLSLKKHERRRCNCLFDHRNNHQPA